MLICWFFLNVRIIRCQPWNTVHSVSFICSRENNSNDPFHFLMRKCSVRYTEMIRVACGIFFVWLWAKTFCYLQGWLSHAELSYHLQTSYWSDFPLITGQQIVGRQKPVLAVLISGSQRGLEKLSTDMIKRVEPKWLAKLIRTQLKTAQDLTYTTSTECLFLGAKSGLRTGQSVVCKAQLA